MLAQNIANYMLTLQSREQKEVELNLDARDALKRLGNLQAMKKFNISESSIPNLCIKFR